MGRNRRLGLLGLAVVAAVVAAVAGAGAGQGGPVGPVGIQHVYPGGTNPEGMDSALPPAPLNTLASLDNVGDYLRYHEQAAALPVADANLQWRDRGPFGIDMPPGYSQSGERFETVSGMGTAIAVPAGSPDTVFVGNMGGLWKSADGGAHWVNLTDGKIPTVAVGAIGLDPARPGDIYVGTGISYLTLSGDANGTGIYVSHDGGKTFTRPAQTTTGYGTNRILVTPQAVFAATNNGLFRSIDHGASFSRVPLPTNAAGTAEAIGKFANWVSDVVAKPGTPDEITAAVGFPEGKVKLADGTIAAPGNGLYRSTTGGGPGSFSRMAGSSQLTNPAASSDPIGRISLAYGQAPMQGDVLWALVSDAGLTAGLAPAGLNQIQTAAGRSLNADNTVVNGVYRSDTDGTAWTVKANAPSLLAAVGSTISSVAPLGYGPGVQAYYNNWIATDPKVPDQVYFGLEEGYQSTANAGPTPGLMALTSIEKYADICGFQSYFQNVTNGAACPNETPIYGGTTTHPDQHSAVVVATPTGSRIYTGNDGGFFRQDSHTLPTGQIGFDNQSWTAINDMSSVEPWHVALLPDQEVIAGLQDNGAPLVDSHGHGIEVCGGDGINVMATPDPNVFYCSYVNALLYVTTDHGHHITEIQPALTNPGFLSPDILDPTDPNHLIAAGENVMESRQGANTKVTFDPVTGTIISDGDWQTSFDAGMSPSISPTTGQPIPYTSSALAARGAVIYAAMCGACRTTTADPRLIHDAIATDVKPGCTPAVHSTNCWHLAKSLGLPHLEVSGIAIDPTDPRTIYVSCDADSLYEYPVPVAGAQRVLVSHDGGDHFTDVSGDLPRTNVHAIVWRAGQIIVATDVGIFVDAAGDGHWSRLGTGNPTGVVARDLSLDPTGRYLLASEYGRGVWELDFGAKAVSSGGPGPKGEPVVVPTRSTGSLPATGSSPWLAVLAVLAVGSGLLLAWRRRRS
ncbi:MAG TPA: LPXTG cell wall anchor domain-containing protein [Mycobacteriales bacterium]|nr:LPXTG cell wall anchor domain-containing protein [Mycobacteriales bacterium]